MRVHSSKQGMKLANGQSPQRRNGSFTRDDYQLFAIMIVELLWTWSQTTGSKFEWLTIQTCKSMTEDLYSRGHIARYTLKDTEPLLGLQRDPLYLLLFLTRPKRKIQRVSVSWLLVLGATYKGTPYRQRSSVLSQDPDAVPEPMYPQDTRGTLAPEPLYLTSVPYCTREQEPADAANLGRGLEGEEGEVVIVTFQAG